MDDEAFDMLTDCQNREERLTDWERTFIDSVSDQVLNSRSLSEKQCTILEEIWERVTSEG